MGIPTATALFQGCNTNYMKIKVLHFTVHKNTDSMNFFCKKKKKSSK